MKELDIQLQNLSDTFPETFTQEQRAKAQTLFLKTLSEKAHRFYGGKMQTLPKAGIWGFNWFNVWYTPGVSKVSTTIRDHHDASYDLSNRGNLVAVVSDSTRVLGDGDCSPSGGLGVMEGKAFLMKYLGGVDAVALCIDSYNVEGKHDPKKIIDFVKMAQPSFGAVNLEDISQPNCYYVLDELREICDIPVWHDDAQGTACVTLAGLINSLHLAGKEIQNVKTVLYGSGASNTTIASFLMQAGMPGKNIILFDSKSGVHIKRDDLKQNPDKFRQWHLAEKTNPDCIDDIQTAMKGAEVLIALSTPGPGTIKPEWIKAMGSKPIVFACANPVPEIYPYAAKEAGAYIVATGRGDFPNQVNNSLGFPGILKGALMVRARKITDSMAICAARSLAEYARKRGITEENIIPNMEEVGVFPEEAAAVAMQAIEDGVARIKLTYAEAYAIAKRDIEAARRATQVLIDEGCILKPPIELLKEAWEETIRQIVE
jgi:malate dehydrogenase (oxaloacetate-decarboxylating)